MAKAEGKTFDYVDESHIGTDLLEVFDFDSPDQYIKSETDEFSAVCPFSGCLLYTSPSPRDATLSRMPSSA